MHEENYIAYERHERFMNQHEEKRRKDPEDKTMMVIGLGETGRPLFEILSGIYRTIGWDYKNDSEFPEIDNPIEVLHICFPFGEWGGVFLREAAKYIRITDPHLTIIESSVPPGTTRFLWNLFKDRLFVHSPIRGNIKDGMKKCLFEFTKFIGPMTERAGLIADYHYRSLGFKTRICSKPETTELMKILNTSYYGLCISWFQEMLRIAKKMGSSWEDIVEFLRTTDEESGGRIPRPIYDPGFIGGHCVIPNAKLLNILYPSKFLDALLESNEKRGTELASK